jgi:hypothetical protein
VTTADLAPRGRQLASEREFKVQSMNPSDLSQLIRRGKVVWPKLELPSYLSGATRGSTIGTFRSQKAVHFGWQAWRVARGLCLRFTCRAYQPEPGFLSLGCYRCGFSRCSTIEIQHAVL